MSAPFGFHSKRQICFKYCSFSHEQINRPTNQRRHFWQLLTEVISQLFFTSSLVMKSCLKANIAIVWKKENYAVKKRLDIPREKYLACRGRRDIMKLKCNLYLCRQKNFFFLFFYGYTTLRPFCIVILSMPWGLENEKWSSFSSLRLLSFSFDFPSFRSALCPGSILQPDPGGTRPLWRWREQLRWSWPRLRRFPVGIKMTPP